MLTVGSLFSGIGGFDLGLERAGMRVIWQSEIDPYASAVLRKHWPHVPNLGDIRNITASGLRAADAERAAAQAVADAASTGCETRGGYGMGIDHGSRGHEGQFARANLAAPDVICGGFPCQDISNAGKRAGIDGERSGLWSEYARVIGELRPRYVLVENVSALLGRGVERVLGDLSVLGYDCEWHVISAADVGAPHLRKRVWIIAHARSDKLRIESGRCESERSDSLLAGNDGAQEHVADADFPRLEGRLRESLRECSDERAAWTSGAYTNADGEPQEWASEPRRERGQWLTEPDVGRVANGIPARVDRLRCLGNAIVPQCAEVIGKALIESLAR